MKQKKTELIAETLINKMFEIAGHQVTYQDIKGRTDNWYQQWTMTKDQNYEWMVWGTDYLKKQLKTNKKLAEREMGWINLNWGLRTSDEGTIEL